MKRNAGLKNIKMVSGHFYSARPIHGWLDEVINRKEYGHWEADTLLVKAKNACIATLVDRS